MAKSLEAGLNTRFHGQSEYKSNGIFLEVLSNVH
jgi:hypothetical protein